MAQTDKQRAHDLIDKAIKGIQERNLDMVLHSKKWKPAARAMQAMDQLKWVLKEDLDNGGE